MRHSPALTTYIIERKGAMRYVQKSFGEKSEGFENKAPALMKVREVWQCEAKHVAIGINNIRNQPFLASFKHARHARRNVRHRESLFDVRNKNVNLIVIASVK